MCGVAEDEMDLLFTILKRSHFNINLIFKVREKKSEFENNKHEYESLENIYLVDLEKDLDPEKSHFQDFLKKKSDTRKSSF